MINFNVVFYKVLEFSTVRYAATANGLWQNPGGNSARSLFIPTETLPFQRGSLVIHCSR